MGGPPGVHPSSKSNLMVSQINKGQALAPIALTVCVEEVLRKLFGGGKTARVDSHRPRQTGHFRRLLLIALFLVKPVLGPRQIFRPVVQMEISPPALGLGLIVILWRIPREISP